MTAGLLEFGAVAGAGYEAEEHQLISTDTPAGWALILAVIGFILVAVTLGKGRGFRAGLGATLGLAMLVVGTELWTNFLARSYALSHPDSPIAGGVGLNL